MKMARIVIVLLLGVLLVSGVACDLFESEPEPTPKPTPVLRDVIILEHESKISLPPPSYGYHVSGRIQNVGTVYMSQVGLRVDFYGGTYATQDTIVHSDTTTVYGLSPGEVEDFNIDCTYSYPESHFISRDKYSIYATHVY